jgi:hypothetical protein
MRVKWRSQLGGGNNAHNRGVVDVEAPGNTRQTFPVDVLSPDDLADLVGSVCPLREPRYE